MRSCDRHCSAASPGCVCVSDGHVALILVLNCDTRAVPHSVLFLALCVCLWLFQDVRQSKRRAISIGILILPCGLARSTALPISGLARCSMEGSSEAEQSPHEFIAGHACYALFLLGSSWAFFATHALCDVHRGQEERPRGGWTASWGLPAPCCLAACCCLAPALLAKCHRRRPHLSCRRLWHQKAPRRRHIGLQPSALLCRSSTTCTCELGHLRDHVAKSCSNCGGNEGHSSTTCDAGHRHVVKLQCSGALASSTSSLHCISG